MAANMQKYSLTFLVLLSLQTFYSANAQSFIGVNYGDQASELSQPADTVNLLKSTTIAKVRLLGSVDLSMMKALENTSIEVVMGLDNTEICWVASGPTAASQWINAKVLPYYPASKIIIITVGNEVLTSENQILISALLPAMQNIQNALDTASLGEKIKVTTVHSMDVLGQFSPPSSGAFHVNFVDAMKDLLKFQTAHGSPFMINAFPFYEYKSNPTPEMLAFCLFQPNSGRLDSKSNITYMNMFDMEVDAVRSALNAMGYKDMEIVVAQTGWPYEGSRNEVGPSLDNAKAYVGNLINHLRSNIGTPLMPGMSVDTYIYELYDEDEPTGPSSLADQSFGLYNSDGSSLYDAGLFKSSQNPIPLSTSTLDPTPVPISAGLWCVPKPAGVSDAQLEKIIISSCSQGIDCSPIKPGGACFEPNTTASHAAYVMNLHYQFAGGNPWDCNFFQTATITAVNPSYGGCVYPSGST